LLSFRCFKSICDAITVIYVYGFKFILISIFFKIELKEYK